MEDSKIIDLYFDRNEEAIVQTQLKYGRLCRSVADNILNNKEDSEECENDTYLTLWNSIPPEKPNNFKAFLIRIARNLSLKRLEYNTADKRNPRLAISWEELEDCIPDHRLAQEIEDRELGELLSKFLHREKEHIRNVFIRRYYFGDDILDIADRYGFSESKVKSILFAVRNKLKSYLTEEGVYL